jgi:hypothetical protein
LLGLDHINFKSKAVWIVGAVVLVALIVLAKKGSTGSASGGGSSTADQLSAYYAAQSANQIQLAQISSQDEATRLAAGVQTLQATAARDVRLAEVNAGQQVATLQIESTNNLQTSAQDYAYDLGLHTLQNNRDLGTLQINTSREVALTQMDLQRELTNKTLESEEFKQTQQLGFEREKLASGERVTANNNSTAVQVTNLQGSYSVQMAKAMKKSGWDNFLGGLGGGIGTLLGGLI